MSENIRNYLPIFSFTFFYTKLKKIIHVLFISVFFFLFVYLLIQIKMCRIIKCFCLNPTSSINSAGLRGVILPRLNLVASAHLKCVKNQNKNAISFNLLGKNMSLLSKKKRTNFEIPTHKTKSLRSMVKMNLGFDFWVDRIFLKLKVFCLFYFKFIYRTQVS